MRALIIPDIHHHTENAEHWLTTQRYDRAIFLGDYFDDYGDNLSDARQTALWLRDRMDSTDDVFLLGNHDAAYLLPNDAAIYCPGFTKAKAHAIRETLQPRHWNRLKAAHAEQGWLLSHAGFHPMGIDNPTIAKILRRCEKAMTLARKGKADPILCSGYRGFQYSEGPLWMAWENFLPVAGINQIVGHSPDSHVRKRITRRSKNICLDVRNASVAALLTNGRLTILERHSESP